MADEIFRCPRCLNSWFIVVRQLNAHLITGHVGRKSGQPAELYKCDQCGDVYGPNIDYTAYVVVERRQS